MIIKYNVSRLTQVAISLALGLTLSACEQSSELASGALEPAPAASSASAAPVLPNRFADVDYPDAFSHSWSGPEEIYQKTCAYCHGDGPEAGVGPELLGRQLPPVYITYTVRNGRNGMPGFGQTEFSDDQLAAVAEMIRDSEAPAAVVPAQGEMMP